jgi:hypothetical protein
MFFVLENVHAPLAPPPKVNAWQQRKQNPLPSSLDRPRSLQEEDAMLAAALELSKQSIPVAQ